MVDPGCEISRCGILSNKVYLYLSRNDGDMSTYCILCIDWEGGGMKVWGYVCREVFRWVLGYIFMFMFMGLWFPAGCT